MDGAAGLPGAPWRWLSRRTLRGRLIAGLLVLLARGCAVVGGATYFATRHVLLVELDSQLRSSARLYQDACVRHPPPPGAIPHGRPPDAPGCGYFPGQAANTLDATLSHGVFTSKNVVSAPCRLTRAEDVALARLPLAGRRLPPHGGVRPRP